MLVLHNCMDINFVIQLSKYMKTRFSFGEKIMQLLENSICIYIYI